MSSYVIFNCVDKNSIGQNFFDQEFFTSQNNQNETI